jgi:hypothetical protein
LDSGGLSLSIDAIGQQPQPSGDIRRQPDGENVKHGDGDHCGTDHGRGNCH